MAAPRKRTPVEPGMQTVVVTGNVGSVGNSSVFPVFNYGRSSGGGGGGGGGGSPRSSSPPPDDAGDYGSGDPSDFPPFVDPNDPIFEPKEPGSNEPPDQDLPEVSVVATSNLPSAAAFPFAPLAATPAPSKPPRRAPVRRRRSVPPKRTRPVRPATKPALPRIRIPLPEVVVRAARSFLPLAGVLALVPPYISALGRIDRYGTDFAYNRMFPPVTKEKKRGADDFLGSRSPEQDVARGGAPVGDIADDPGLDGVPQVTVTSPRARPVAAPTPVFEPSVVGQPAVDPVPFAPPAGRPSPRPGQRANPRSDPVGAPNVLQEPVPFAAPKPRPLPEPAPSSPGGPGPSPPATVSPIAPPSSSLDPLPEPEPVPAEDPCAEQKAKKRKKRSDRAICWKGTYIEKSRGISKTRRVRVDCTTGKELAPAPSSSPMKKPKGGWPKSLKDVLQPS